MRIFSLAMAMAAVALTADLSHAVDVTTCGQTVAGGAVLPADLDWPDVTPTLWYMAVYDVLRPGSYADFIAESPRIHQDVATDSRSWDVCE